MWQRQKKWSLKQTKPSTATVIGASIALGLEVHYKGGPKNPFEAAASYAGANYIEGSDKSLKGTQELVRRGVELGMATNLGLKEILDVERFFGRIKPDLVGRNHDGALVVVDHKVKLNQDEKYLSRNLQDYDDANQFWHYAWGVGQEYGELVEYVIAHVIILAPIARTLLHPVKIEPEHLQFWLRGVVPTWDAMKDVENGLEPEARFSACKNRYGLCDQYQACHTFHGDERAFPVFYERV